MQAGDVIFLPKCHDELSVAEVPFATAWRFGHRPVRGSSSFPLGTAIAFLDAMPRPRQAVRQNAGPGFTLLEIMVVIALISLLTTGVAVGALKMLRDSEDKQARTNAATLAAVAETFMINDSSAPCPTPEEMKRAGVLSSRSSTEDPWGTTYRIVCEPGSPVAISAGRDKTFGTGDDVKSYGP